MVKKTDNKKRSKQKISYEFDNDGDEHKTYFKGYSYEYHNDNGKINERRRKIASDGKRGRVYEYTNPENEYTRDLDESEVKKLMESIIPLNFRNMMLDDNNLFGLSDDNNRLLNFDRDNFFDEFFTNTLRLE